MSEELTDEIKRRHDESLPTVDESVVNPTDPTDDPRLGVTDVMFERHTVIDVLSGLPAGHSIDQTLGFGLDGAPIDTTPNHYGIGDDDLLSGRSTDSPRDMARDSLFGTDADTNKGEPPDIATGSANPTRNKDLVSGEDGGTDDDKDFVDDVVDWVDDLFNGGTAPTTPDAGTVRPEGDTAIPKPKPKPQPTPGGDDDYLTNPDADTGGGGTPTEADIERAIAKQGGDIDFVEGFEKGPAITGELITRPIDLLRDPVDDDQGSGAVTVVGDLGHLPQDEISHTVNPGDGLPTPMAPPPGSGQPGTGGDDTGMGSAAREPDALSVSIDASIDLQDTLDSAFDSAFAPLPDGAGGAQFDGPPGDDGF